MSNSDATRPGANGAPDTIASGLREIWRIGGRFWRGEARRTAWALSLGLALVTLGHALLQLRLNLWLGDFFNALDVRAGATILRDFGLFALIALGLMATTAAQIHLKMGLQIGWRGWITRRLTDRWLAKGHSYVLHFRGGDFDNPDYRIGEDVRLFTEGAVDFATGLLNSALLLTIFLGVLWSVSSPINLVIGAIELDMPGYLVFAAIAYAGVSTTLTHLIGRRLISVSGALHAREGDFRYQLVRVRESSEDVAFLRGQANERRGLDRVFERLADTWRALMGLQARLTWLTNGFTVLTPVVPLVIAAPQYVAGEMSLGALIQASQAFVQVQLALGFVIDNYARLSDWMAAINRIVQLKTAIDDIERDLVEPGERHIALRPSPEGALRFVDLNVDGSDGTVVIDNASEAIKPGERVLIIGESGVGKTTLLRAIAGLWPWGSGTIELPPEERMMFMLHRPYMSPGTLRAALAYPEPPERFGEAELRSALTRCGLQHFIDRLDDEARWDEAMGEGEQQRLAFARLLVHRPAWVLMDEATSELDEAAEADMMSLFKNELAGTTLVSTGQRASLAAYHDRTLTLARSPDGAHLFRGSPKPRRAALGRRFLPW